MKHSYWLVKVTWPHFSPWWLLLQGFSSSRPAGSSGYTYGSTRFSSPSFSSSPTSFSGPTYTYPSSSPEFNRFPSSVSSWVSTQSRPYRPSSSTFLTSSTTYYTASDFQSNSVGLASSSKYPSSISSSSSSPPIQSSSSSNVDRPSYEIIYKPEQTGNTYIQGSIL